jgi:hypothetical protein
VDWAIDLNDKVFAGTEEVDDERAYGMLTTELASEKASTAKLLPQELLAECLGSAKFSGGVDHASANACRNPQHSSSFRHP